MAFYFTCPFCLHKTLIDEQLSGQRGPCVACGKQVTIPSAPARRPENIAPAEDRQAPIIIVPKRRRLSPFVVKAGIFIAVSVPVFLFGIWLLAPTVMQLKTARDIAACKHNLRRIARALNAYAADYGTYPPPITLDASGKPMHSWRVLILPYLGEKRLYEAYDMSQPWDAPENANVQARIPGVYVSPANSKAGIVGESSYMLVTGKGTLFPPSGPLSPSAIHDGADNTILVVETNNATIPWTSPTDLNAAALPGQIGVLGGIGGTHTQGATVVFADGEAGWLPFDTNKNIVDGLLSPNGTESVRGAWYR
jgi:hypothetical protein